MNSKEESLKEIADKLMSQEGNVKGEVFRTHANFIKHKEGEDALKKVEEKMKELGYPLEFKKVKTGDWHKESLSALVIVVCKNIFNWERKDVFEMGNMAPKHSFIIRMFVKHFISLKDVFEKAGQYWDRHYDFGSMEKGYFNEKEKRLVLKIKGYIAHELVTGPYFRGYITRIAQFSLKSQKIETEQTKSVHHGDPYNEYVIRWT